MKAEIVSSLNISGRIVRCVLGMSGTWVVFETYEVNRCTHMFINLTETLLWLFCPLGVSVRTFFFWEKLFDGAHANRGAWTLNNLFRNNFSTTFILLKFKSGTSSCAYAAGALSLNGALYSTNKRCCNFFSSHQAQPVLFLIPPPLIILSHHLCESQVLSAGTCAAAQL